MNDKETKKQFSISTFLVTLALIVVFAVTAELLRTAKEKLNPKKTERINK